MSLLRALFDGFSEGVRIAAECRQVYSNGTCQRGRIDRLCRELGWSVDERQGTVIHLHFNDPVYGIRKVRITNGDESLVTFSAYSSAVFHVDDVSTDVLGYLLLRNVSGSGIGQWGAFVNDNDKATFHLMYDALGDGLDAQALQYITQSLAAEAADFDGKLRQSGLLR